MVTLCLIGVMPGEPAHRLVQFLPRTDISGDHGCAAGPGVTLGQQSATHLYIVGQCLRAERVHRDGSLHIAELPHVELPPGHGRPAQQRVADRLQSLLILHHPLTLVGVPCAVAVNVPRDDRASSLLQLQEQHVVGAAALAQHHVGTQGHAADADHLVGDVHHGVSAQHPPPMGRQRAQVLIEALDELLGLLCGQPGDQRRLLDDPPTRRPGFGEPRQRTVTDPATRPLRRASYLLAQPDVGGAGMQLIGVQSFKRALQQRLTGQPPNLLPVGRRTRGDDLFTLRFRMRVLPPGHPDAGRQPP